VVFVAALLLRAGWVLACWQRDGPALEFPDEQLHWQLARNLVQDGTLVSDDGRYAPRMPLYPLLLALFAGLGDAGVLTARLVQAGLGAATAWGAYLIAEKFGGPRCGLVAGVLVCLDPYAIFFTDLLLTETLFSAVLVALVGAARLSLSTQAQEARRGGIGVALLGAAAVMTRPSAAGWLLLLWLALWLADRGRARATRRLALCAGVLAGALLPWGLRNRAVIGAPAWLSTNGGVSLYDALGPQADGSSNQAFLAHMPELAQLTEVQRDQRLRQLALEQVRRHPGRLLRLAWVKFCRTWSPIPNVSTYRGGATGMLSAAFTGLLLIGALAGLARAVFGVNDTSAQRPDRRLHLLLWLPVLYFTLLHCVFVGSLRYRVPLMPLLSIAAATAVAHPRRLRPAAPFARR